MRHVVQRFGFRISRGWAMIIVVLGALIGTAFWIGPFRPMPPDLRLLALGSDGQFRDSITMTIAAADTAPLQPDITARFPIVLAIHNQGARPAVPQRVALSVPARFRIANAAGQAYEGQVSPGNPLVRYVFEVKTGPVAPGQMPRVIANLDTLWLEPVVPSYYCTATGDGNVEFVVAQRLEPQAIARPQIFYSFDARVRDRQTGVLSIQLPPELLDRATPPTPPHFETTIYRPQAPRPAMGTLRKVGARTSHCGEAGAGTEVYDVLWETETGGRFFVLHSAGVPRKHLFDLDRDSIIELEQWDGDGDGVFESSRTARMTIPEFLMPARRPVIMVRDSVTGDSVRVDSTGVPVDSTGAPAEFQFPAGVFHNTEGGPLRFWRAQQRARGLLPAEPPRPQRPRQAEDWLIGKPLPNYPTPPRRDTVRRDTLQERFL